MQIQYLERSKVCNALKRLRLGKPDFRRKSKFKQATGLHLGTITDTEEGRILPSLETIDKWVQACDVNLADFIASLIDVPSPPTIVIPPEHRRIIQLVLQILDDAPTEAQDWITGCIETFYRCYIPKGYKKPKH